MDRIKIHKLDNTLVIRKIPPDSNSFITTSDSIIIDIPTFASILKSMLFLEIISPKLLDGILGEYNDSRQG